MRWLVVIFVGVPLLELYLLAWLADVIGFPTTIAITLVTGIVGSWLAKREGLRAWRQWRSSLDALQAPEIGLIEGLLILVGGALLITPGVLTDVMGFALLLPPTRKALAEVVKTRVTHYVEVHTTSVGSPTPRRPSTGGPVIESVGESLDVDDPRERTPPAIDE